jgi:hypothetical protein
MSVQVETLAADFAAAQEAFSLLPQDQEQPEAPAQPMATMDATTETVALGAVVDLAARRHANGVDTTRPPVPRLDMSPHPLAKEYAASKVGAQATAGRREAQAYRRGINGLFGQVVKR